MLDNIISYYTRALRAFSFANDALICDVRWSLTDFDNNIGLPRSPKQRNLTKISVFEGFQYNSLWNNCQKRWSIQNTSVTSMPRRVYGLISFRNYNRRNRVKKPVNFQPSFVEKHDENIILLIILLVIIVPSLVWTTKHFISCLREDCCWQNH